MMKIVIENLLLFMLPTCVYLGYVLLTRQAPPASGNKRQAELGTGGLLDDAPLLYLFAAGLVLVVGTLVFFQSSTGGKPNQPYTPPSIKDGRVEPGHVN